MNYFDSNLLNFSESYRLSISMPIILNYSTTLTINWFQIWSAFLCDIEFERLLSAQYIYICEYTHIVERATVNSLALYTYLLAWVALALIVLVQRIVNVFLYNCQTFVYMWRCHVILLTVQCIHYNSGPVCQVTKSSRTTKTIHK